MLGAIIGGIAGSVCESLSYLDAPLREVYERWCAYCECYTPLSADVPCDVPCGESDFTGKL
jgi:hypothetical protein